MLTLLKGYEGTKISILVNGHAVDAVVSIGYEFDDFDHQYMERTLVNQITKDIELGLTSCIAITVLVSALGLEGRDSLSCVFVRASSFEKDLMQSVLDHGMVHNAGEDLSKQILDAAIKLQKYTKVA